MEANKFLIAVAVMVVGIAVISGSGWLVGVFVLPLLIGVAGYMIWEMIKSIK